MGSARHRSAWWVTPRIAVVLFFLFSFAAEAQLSRTVVPLYWQTTPAQTFVDARCPFYILPPEIEGETVSCGYLVIPENRDNPESRKIQLAVMRIESHDPTSREPPIVYLEGGPGGAAIPDYAYFYRHAFRDTHDIILVDQRGTGFSRPSLNCPEFDQRNGRDPLRGCVQRLRADDIDLSAYHSRASAADVAALIDVLELESVHLYGTSYGSRLALTIMRDYPQHLRSVILEAVYPPNVNLYDQQAQAAYRAFERLFATCANDFLCASTYPDLREVFYATIPALNDEPLDVYYEKYQARYRVNGTHFVDELFLLLYSDAWVQYVPALIYAAHERDAAQYGSIEPPPRTIPAPPPEFYPALNAAIAQVAGMPPGRDVDAFVAMLSLQELEETTRIVLGDIDANAEGVYYSVACSEEVPFNSLAGYEAQSQGVPTPLTSALATGIQLQFVACDAWDVQAASEIENQAVTSDLPVLLLSGEYDPITPPGWGEIAARTLPNGQHLIFPGMGHGVIENHPCPTQIAQGFLQNPTATLQTDCIRQMRTRFVLRSSVRAGSQKNPDDLSSP